MMHWSNDYWVRITHIPTGLAAMSRGCGRRPRLCHEWAEGMLKSKLAKRQEDPRWREGCYPRRERVRSYHLHPGRGAGMPPFARDHRSGRAIPIDIESLFGGGGWDWFLSAPKTGRLLDRLMLARRSPAAPPPA